MTWLNDDALENCNFKIPFFETNNQGLLTGVYHFEQPVKRIISTLQSDQAMKYSKF